MTGYRSSHFRWNCERDKCYIGELPSWDWFIDVFPRGIIPTDVDGMVEINSWFLFIEQKRAGASLPEGQRKALQRLSTTSDRITVVIIREIVGEDDLMEVLRYRGGQTSGWKKETHDELRTWMDAWAVHADGYSD